MSFPPPKRSRWDTDAPVSVPQSRREILLTERFTAAEVNKPWITEELDIILPGPNDGYEVLQPPDIYFRPREREATPEPESRHVPSYNITPAVLGLPPIHPDEERFFEGAMDGLDQNGNEIDHDNPIDIKSLRRTKRYLLFLRYGSTFQRRKSRTYLTNFNDMF
ncbi:hypothetical protein RCL1_004653 [Eukaryota sp. TZLM3-RCL]